MSLGLHHKSKESLVWPARAEGFSRIWWSLLSLQSILCCTTGRPSAIALGDFNTSFPQFPEGGQERSSGLFMHVNFKISIIAQWAMSSLYSVKAATLTWPRIHEQVIRMKSELEKLLPEISGGGRLILQFSWMDTMAIVTRPCLGRRNEHTDSTSFETNKIAAECIRAARGVTQLLPDEPNECIFQNGPWWCLSLYIMRAMAVLLLARSHPSSNSTDDDVSLILAVKKLIKWLQWMRPKDVVADRGLTAVLNTLRRAQDHGNFAEALEQEAAGAYGGYLLVPDRWRGDSSATYPQLQPEFETLDDSDFMANMLSQSTLPMPPVYGSAFAADENTWDW